MRREIQEQSGLSPQKIGFAKGWLTNQPTGEQPNLLSVYFSPNLQHQKQISFQFCYKRDPQRYKENIFLYDKSPQKKKNENQPRQKGKHVHSTITQE